MDLLLLVGLSVFLPPQETREATAADFAFLDDAAPIPWAAPELVDRFVAHLRRNDANERRRYPPVLAGGLGTFPGEVRPNHYDPEVFRANAAHVAHFAEQLRDLGIDFLFALIPESSMVYPDHWWPELPLLPSGLPPQITRGTRLLFEELERREVRCVNLSPAFLLARRHSTLGHPRQFTHDGKDNSHWTPYGAALSAHVLARAIERAPWYPELPKLEGLAARWVRLADEEPPGDDTRTLRWERRVTGLPSPAEQARRWRDAPILVLGDSNLDSRYGFASQLAYELRVPVQTLGREGDGPGLALEAARRDPDWWLAKRLIVQLFANRAYGRPLDAKGDLLIFPEGLEATRARARLLAGGSARLTLRATLEAVSTARSPEDWAPYTSALIYLRFRVDHVFGDGVVPVNPAQVIGVGWGLVDAKPTWLTTAEPGTRYVLNLEALALHAELLEVGADTDAVEDLLMPPYLIKAMRNLDDGSRQRPLPRGPKR